MSLYYLLLFFERFHDNPRLGGPLFNVGFFVVTPVKVVGAAAVIAALISRRPNDAVPRQRNALAALFLASTILPFMVARASGDPVPDNWLSAVLSFAMLLLATRLLICAEQRMYSTIRVLVFLYAFSCLWAFKQHFVQGEGRALGLELDPNYEALGLVVMIPLAVWVARHETRRWLSRLALCSVPLFAYSVLLTESRGGMLALAALGLGGFLRSRHKAALAIAFVAFAPLAAVVLPAGLLSRVGSTTISATMPDYGDAESSVLHFELLRGGLRMMVAHPVVGVGVGNFSEEVLKYNRRLLYLSGGPYIAHNTYLQVGSECGLPVLAMWLGLILSALNNLRRAESLERGKSPGELAAAIRFALLAYSVAALFLTAEWVVPFWLMIFLSQNLREIVEAKYAEAGELERKPSPVRVRYLPVAEGLLDA